MRSFYLILLFLWLIAGYFICKKYVCHHNGASAAVAAPIIEDTDGDGCNTQLIFRDTLTGLNLISPNSFEFEESNEDFNLLDEDLELMIGDVVTHFGEHPDMTMYVYGYALESETNSTEYETLGLARANIAKTYFLTKGVNPDQVKVVEPTKNISEACMEDGILKKGIAILVRNTAQ
jgi:hypothetical protein